MPAMRKSCFRDSYGYDEPLSEADACRRLNKAVITARNTSKATMTTNSTIDSNTMGEPMRIFAYAIHRRDAVGKYKD